MKQTNFCRKKDGFFERSDVGPNVSSSVFITCMEFLESGDIVTGDSEVILVSLKYFKIYFRKIFENFQKSQKFDNNFRD